MPDLLDIGFPPDAATLAADVKAAGARLAGIYVINLSAAGTVQTPQYAQAVAAAGVEVLPIITPGETPPPVSGVPDALKAWGQLNSMNAVALDIEQPGVDTPDPGWVVALVNTLSVAGYVPWLYCNASTRPSYPWGAWWLADWESQPNSTGYIAWQYTDQYVGQSGTRYDASTLTPSLGPLPLPVPVPTDDWNTSGGDDMVLLTNAGGRVDFIHIGTDYQVYHRWKNQAFQDIATQNEVYAHGAPAGKKLVKIAAGYDDGGQRIDLVAGADDTTMWGCQVNIADGKIWNDWFPIQGAVLVAQAGTQGPPGPDVRPQVAAALELAVKNLAS